jgi:hypothetical protein
MIEAYATGFRIRIAPYTDRDPIGFTLPWANTGIPPPTRDRGARGRRHRL